MFNYNIKKIVVMLTAVMILSFSAAAIIFIATGGINKSFISMNPKNSQTYSINEEKANKVKDIKEIYVDNSFPDINVKVENTDEVKAHLYGKMTSNFKPKLETKVEGNKLIIKSSSESHFGFMNFSGNLNLDITIPSSYNSSIEINSASGKVTTLSPLKLSDFKIHLASGDTNLKDLTAEDLTVKSSSGVITGGNVSSKNTHFESTSGNIKLKSLTTEDIIISSSSGVINGETITSKKASIKSTSGDIIFKNLTSDNLAISSSSGSIKGDTVNSKDTLLSSTSGDMKLSTFKGNIDQKTSSGKVLITYSEFNNNVKLSSTSGDITLNLPKDSQFKLNAETTSGDINCSFPITIQEKSKKDNLLIGTVGSDKNSIEVTASSGDVDINSK